MTFLQAQQQFPSVTPSNFWEQIETGGIALMLTVSALIIVGWIVNKLFKAYEKSKQDEIDRLTEQVKELSETNRENDNYIRESQRLQIEINTKLMALVTNVSTNQAEGRKMLIEEIIRSKEHLVEHINNLPSKIKQ